MNSRGVELAMSTIVIAIVLLVVMIVMLMIFRGVWSGANLPGFVKCEFRSVFGGTWECVEGQGEGILCIEGGGCPENTICCKSE
ncbi:MAG: hypothetical protein ACMXYL_04630 [Candidatus Woesearchaeota archaeon]